MIGLSGDGFPPAEVATVNGILKGIVMGACALLLASACGGDDGESTTCGCTCSCDGAAATTLKGAANADECKTDCQASCSGIYDGKYECK